MVGGQLFDLLECFLPVEGEPLPQLPAIVAYCHLHELLVCSVPLLPFLFKQFKFDVGRLQLLDLRFEPPDACLSEFGYVFLYLPLFRPLAVSTA